MFGLSKAEKLTQAVRTGRWNDASGLLRDVRPVDQGLFHWVVAHAPPNVVAEWIDAGADVKGLAGDNLQPPINVAAMQDRIDLIDMLVLRGADMGQTDSTGVSALMAAAYLGKTNALMSLCRLGAPLELGDREGFTALMFAANAGNLPAVKILLLTGANPNARDSSRSTPAMFAAQHDHLDCLQVIVKAGGDLTAVGDHGLSPLEFARKNGRESTAKWIESQMK